MIDTDFSCSSSASSSISTSTTSEYPSSPYIHEPQSLPIRQHNYTQQQETDSIGSYNRQRNQSHRQSIIARSLNKGQKVWHDAILDPDSTLMPWTKYCNEDKYSSNDERMLEPLSTTHSSSSILHAYYRDNDLYPL